MVETAGRGVRLAPGPGRGGSYSAVTATGTRSPAVRRARGAWLALLLQGVLALAAPRAGSAAVQVLTTADGLSSDDVRAWLEDESGRLWFGSSRGVDRYDGVTWRAFGAAEGLTGAIVHDLIETGAGAIWAATDSALARWEGGRWRSFGVAGGPAHEPFLGLLEGHDGTLWARTRDAGLARFDGGAWTRVDAAGGLASNQVRDWTRGADGTLWVATSQGVSRHDGTAWSTWTAADGLADNDVVTLLAASDGAMWFATRAGLSRRRAGQWTTFTTADGLAHNTVAALVEDAGGGIWAGTGEGVSRWDGTAWRTFTVTHGLADNVVDVAFRDRRGHLWFGARSGLAGVTRWDGVGFDAFTTGDGLAAAHAGGFHQDRAGNLWILGETPASGVTRFDGAFVRSWTPVDGVPHPQVNAAAIGAPDTVWAGTAGGLARWDGARWTTFRTASGLPADSVAAVLADASGRLWVGTRGGLAWRSGNRFVADSAVTAAVIALFEDSRGRLWAGTATRGVYRREGGSWSNLRAAHGLAADEVRAIVESRDGALWFGTPAGISRWDGAGFTTHEGFPSDAFRAAARDSAGALWFGSDAGVVRWDGAAFATLSAADGLAAGAVLAIHTTVGGIRWFCTQTGASRYDGERFVPFGPADGLPGQQVRAATSDRRGRIWLGTLGGVSRLEPDRVPPRGVLTPEPQLVSPSRTQAISFAAAFGESGIEFSHSFDGEPFSPFTREPFVLRAGLLDGPHAFRVRARDGLGNVQDPPTTTRFTVDATAPQPVLARPAGESAVAGRVTVLGTTADGRYARHRVDVRPAGSATWEGPPATRLADATAPVESDTLAVWDTAAFPDGPYELRVAVDDSIGLSGAATIRVTVDNAFPFVDQTAPLTVSAAAGGHVFTTAGEVHLYFPPQAFARDAVVTVEAAAAPDTLNGAVRLGGAFAIGWSQALRKPATLEVAHDALPPGAVPVLHAAGADGVWRPLGGTHRPEAATVAAALDGPARVALFAGAPAPGAGGAIAALTLTPRVFSPRGRFGAARLAIGFSLGRAAPVTVSVYNRAGRLVRTVVEDLALQAGANLVHWDGRAGDGAPAAEGVYLVAVRALGETRTLPLAVVH